MVSTLHELAAMAAFSPTPPGTLRDDLPAVSSRNWLIIPYISARMGYN
jgi:hypothetical protein